MAVDPAHDGPSPPAFLPCGAKPDCADLDPTVGQVYCTGGLAAMHLRREEGCWSSLGPCPAVTMSRHRRRVEREGERLAGLIANLVGPLRRNRPAWRPHPTGLIPVPSASGGGWLDWSDFLCGGGALRESQQIAPAPNAQAAVEAAQRFRADESGFKRLVLYGSHGTGKTLLLLLVHFDALARGQWSVFVTASELRRWIQDANTRWSSASEVAREAAEAALADLGRARQVCVDDVAPVLRDRRQPGEVQEGLGELFSRLRVLAVTSNLDGARASAHPDLGERAVSRLVAGAQLVRLDGDDWREAAADVVTGAEEAPRP